MGLPAKNKCLPLQSPKDFKSLEGKEAEQELSVLAKALAHPARVKIIKLLIDKDACICGEIVSEVSLSQSTVSQHLKVLKESGLICGEIDGPKTCYCINPLVLKRFKVLVANL